MGERVHGLRLVPMLSLCTQQFILAMLLGRVEQRGRPGIEESLFYVPRFFVGGKGIDFPSRMIYAGGADGSECSDAQMEEQLHLVTFCRLCLRWNLDLC